MGTIALQEHIARHIPWYVYISESPIFTIKLLFSMKFYSAWGEAQQTMVYSNLTRSSLT